MKVRFLKILTVFLLTIFIINVTNTYASSYGGVISGGKAFSNSRNSVVQVNQQNLQQTSSSIYNILLTIAFVVDAVIGIGLGIRWMFSGVDEKADVKKGLIIYFIASCVTYGAFVLWRVLINFLQSVF